MRHRPAAPTAGPSPARAPTPTVVTLGERQSAVVAPRPDTPTAFAGTVVDGRVVEVAVAGGVLGR